MEEKNVFKMHFQLAQLRAALYQAMDEGDAGCIEALSARIDEIQKEKWHQEKADRKAE